MNQEEIKRVKAEATRINAKNAKISKIRRKIALAGAVGFVLMFVGLFLGFTVSVDQKIEKELVVSKATNVEHLIGQFVNNLPSILGDPIERKELDNDGMWILSNGIKSKVLISYDIPKGTIGYDVLFSEIGITGKWQFSLKEERDNVVISIVENSVTDNLGYRSQLFFLGEERYLDNLLAPFLN